MHSYRQGYELYKEACQRHGIESLDFDYYFSHLTKEQLYAFNEAK